MADATPTSGSRIAAARARIAMSQRTLAERAGVPQATLSRIESGARVPKMGELIALADALGCTLSQVSQHSPVRDRVVCFARAENGSDMTHLHDELVHLLELDAFLDEYGIE